MRKLAVMAVGLTMIAGAHGAKANLIANGNFSAGGANWSAFQTYNPTASDGVEINPSGVYGLSCYDATCRNMEVNGNTFDTVTQTVSGLTTGANYTLSWAYSGRSGYGVQQLDVSFGGALLATDTSNLSAAWTPQTFTITATGSSEVLSFAAQNVGGSGSGGDEIAGVSLIQAVPEPASLALFGLGAFGLGIIRRQKA
jgi:PEP-CTERM motif